MNNSLFPATQVAGSVPYDNSTSGVSQSDLQSVIDYILVQIAAGPSGLATSASASSSTTSTTPSAMNGMVLTPSVAGNYAVSFSGQFQGTSNVEIWVYVDSTQQVNSLRQAVGPGGTHNFVMATGEKVNITLGQSIYIYWASSSGTVTGRNISAIKVT